MKKLILLIFLLPFLVVAQSTYIIYNPYYGVDWSPAKHYKTNFSALTTQSVGSETPATVINAYANAGYRILSIADETHQSQYRSNTWPWTDYIADVPLALESGYVSQRSALFPTLGDSVFAVMGNTITEYHYMGQHFFNSDYVNHTLYSVLDFQNNRGQGIFTNIGEHSNSAAWYVNHYGWRTRHLKGFEVYNQGNRYSNAIQLWDAVNALMPPNELVWGYSNDYMTETSHLYRNYQHFLFKEAENWLPVTVTERRLRQAMFDGSFYFSYEPDGNDAQSPTYGQADTPKLMGVTTNNSVIAITGENYDYIEWYDNQTTLLGTGTSISVDTVSGNFVRAVLVNSSGRTYTQPFGFKIKSAPFFVAPDGNDSNPGTKEEPFLTIKHGTEQLTPGDTLYLRGGVYHISTMSLDISYYTAQKNYYGTEEYPIVVSAYPPDHAAGNVPIVDGITACDFNNEIVGFWIRDIQWWKFWGISVRNIFQCTHTSARIGWYMQRAYNVYLEQCIAHDIGGYGIISEQRGSVVHIRNCDVYNLANTLFEPPNVAGGMGSGIGVAGSYIEVYDPNYWAEHYVTGSRAWNYSDNGFNVGSGQIMSIVENSWAILGGFDLHGNTYLDGDGRGFPVNFRVNYTPPTIYRNNIAAYIRNSDFSLNTRSRTYQASAIWYNNFSIGGRTATFDGAGGILYPPNAFTMREAHDNRGVVISLKNNVVYGKSKKMSDQTMIGWIVDSEMAWDNHWDWDNPQGIFNEEPTNAVYTHEYNTWNFPEMHLTEADFVGPMDSVSIVAALTAPRKADGSLPDVPNLWPSETSQLRDAGVDVGLPFYGEAPDLGPFQIDPGVTGHILIFQIENENGNAINNASITFNGATRPPGVYTLHGIEEGTYDFSVAAPGYETYVYNGLVVEEDMEISVVMTALPTYNLVFDVKDSNNNPISNAVVTLGNITNPQGNYSFNGVPGGNYNYSVTATGYQTLSITGYEVNADATIEVVMSPNIYTITLNASPAQGGTVSGQGSYTHGQTVSISATPNTGYSFVNWTENGNVVSSQAEYSFTATQNRDLTAHFSIHTYTVSLTADPAGAGNLSGAGTYDHNANITVNAQANAGHTFVNWTENGNVVSTNPQFSFNITSNRSFTANFSVNTYEIQATGSPAEGGSVTGAGTYSYGETAVLTATAADEYNFTYWRENGNVVANQPEYSFTITGNRNLTAHFALDIYELTLLSLPEDAGVLFGAGNYEPGDLVNITAVAEPGYLFQHWSDEAENVVSQDPLYSFVIDDNHTFTAHFVQETYTLTLTPNPTFGGITIGAGSNFTYGQEVTAGALPNPGFQFSAWTENGTDLSFDETYTFNITGNRDLTANFSPQEYLVQVIVDPEGAGFVEGAGNYLHGDYVTLNAYPAQDHVFLQWLQNDQTVSTDLSFSFFAYGDRELTAEFVHVDDLVRIEAGVWPEGFAFIEGSGDYPVEQTVILAATPADNDFSFEGWMENGKYFSRDNPLVFKAENNRIITAGYTYRPGELEVRAELSIPETGHIYGAGNYSRGSIAMLQAELESHVNFRGWRNLAGQIVSRQNPFTFEVNRSMELEAMVELKSGLPLDEGYRLTVYPNPSDGRFTVNIMEEALMTVHNSQGIALETIRITPEENQLNLGYLPSGVYFLRFQTQDDVLSAKIIIR